MAIKDIFTRRTVDQDLALVFKWAVAISKTTNYRAFELEKPFVVLFVIGRVGLSTKVSRASKFLGFYHPGSSEKPL